MTAVTMEDLAVRFEEHRAKNDADHALMLAQQRKVELYLFGNGDVGIGERVRKLEDMAHTIRKLIWIIGVGVVGLFLNFGVELLKWFSASNPS